MSADRAASSFSPTAKPGSIVRGYILPGYPHPLLAPEKAEPWGALRTAFDAVRAEIDSTDADLILLYSTQWISIIGHQMQADPKPVWTLVDPEWHDLGDMPYEFAMDVEFAEAYRDAAEARGLRARTVAYHGFPIDTGSVVTLELVNPENRLRSGIVSCNMYADRAETLVLGKAARDAIEATGRKAIVVAVTALSNRLFTTPIDPADDRISSEKDDEWNRKVLEILSEGRLEDVSQLARQFTREAHADQRMKAIWWLAAVMGQHNSYEGHVFEYQPLWGTGAAVVGLTPSERASADLEFDEEDVEVFVGDRDVLSGSDTTSEDTSSAAADPPAEDTGANEMGELGLVSIGVTDTSLEADTISSRGVVRAAKAPRPVGAFPHARRVGDLLFLSGMGPRTPGNDAIPGGPVRDERGAPLDYDVEAQTRAVIENVRTVLEASGSSLDRVLDVTCFLIDMDRDFETFNRIYAEYFGEVEATRTTIAIGALPTPIAVEFKVIAAAG
jgi:2-aminophenol/2-amino-5-chlorophenol 1,6-dioxygenase alpha subunit